MTSHRRFFGLFCLPNTVAPTPSEDEIVFARLMQIRTEIEQMRRRNEVEINDNKAKYALLAHERSRPQV